MFFDGYLYTFGRELQDLSAISQSRAFGSLLRTAAAELGQRASERVRSVGPRAADYLDLLVSSLTLVCLPPVSTGAHAQLSYVLKAVLGRHRSRPAPR